MDDRPAAAQALTQDEKFALRPEDFRILASDTRVQILKILDGRAMTGTELGKRLDLEKSTVHQHLEKLVEGGLVTRREDDRLWVYYDLSPRGRRLLHPPRAGFTLLLSGSLASAGAAVALFATWVLGNATRDLASAPQDAGGRAEEPVADGAPTAPTEGAAGDGAGGVSAQAEPSGPGFPIVPAIAVALFALAAALGGAAWIVRPK